jgi:hypothetical protein
MPADHRSPAGLSIRDAKQDVVDRTARQWIVSSWVQVGWTVRSEIQVVVEFVLERA